MWISLKEIRTSELESIVLFSQEVHACGCALSLSVPRFLTLGALPPAPPASHNQLIASSELASSNTCVEILSFNCEKRLGLTLTGPSCRRSPNIPSTVGALENGKVATNTAVTNLAASAEASDAFRPS